MTKARISGIAVVALCLASATPADAAQITRGPYLQQQNPDAIRVVWYTDTACTGAVEWGATSGYGNVIQGAPSDTRHEIPITGLSPDTLYHYRVRCDGVPLSGDATFKTAPPPDATAVSFTFVGDTASAPSNAQATYNAMLSEVANGFCITLGDLAGRGEDNFTDYWKLHFFDPAANFLKHVCMYPAIGNHELYDETATFVYPARYLENFSLPTAGSGNEFYYAFDKANVHFASVDTFWSSYAAGSPQHTWLANDLASTTRPWKIVFGHDGAYISEDGKSNGSTSMRAHLVPLFEQHGVDLYLHGHYHNYQRNVVNGVTYIDHGTGGSPWSTKTADDSQSYVQAYADRHYCFTRVDIQDNRLLARCLLTSNGTVLDGYQIDKPPIDMPWTDAFPADGPGLNWIAPWNYESQCGMVNHAGNPSGDGYVFKAADTSGYQYVYPMLSNESLADVSIEADVYYDSSSSVKNRFGIGLRGRLLFSFSERSYYALAFVRNDSLAANGHCLLLKRHNGTETLLADWAHPDTSDWHRLKLSMTGSALSVWVDDELKTTTPITDYSLTKGRPFIYNYRADDTGARTLVDDVVIGPAIGPPAPELITDFEGYADGTQVMFRQPSFSGSTDQHLPVSPNSSQVVTEAAFGGTKVCQVEWAWVDSTPQRWLRITTHDLDRVGNPAIDLTRPLRFRYRLLTPGSLRMCLGVRETGMDVPIGADGGTLGTLEWAGANSTIDGAPQGHLITDNGGQWQTITFDLPNESVQAFTGDGVLAALNDKGVLEHLALAAVDSAGPFTVQFDMFEQLPLDPPIIALQPASQSVLPGGTAIFTLTATGSEPLSYAWQRDAIDLVAGGRYSGVQTSEMTISNVMADDAADYRCVVSNPGGTVMSSVATLTVMGPSVVPGDFDDDGDVDQVDYGHFQMCLTGQNVPQDDPNCTQAKLDDDSDVDEFDLGIFRRCMSGANTDGDPHCAN